MSGRLSSLLPSEPTFDDCNVRCMHPTAVSSAWAGLAAMPPGPAVAGLFGLLADPTRLRLLAALAAGEPCVCDLAIATGVNRSTVSHQPRTPREGRQVRARCEGRGVSYAPDDEPVRDLLAMGGAYAAEAAGAL